MAYDPEEYNVREIMKAEERRERAGEDMERTYFKTLAVVDVTAEDDAAAADGGLSPKEEEDLIVALVV